MNELTITFEWSLWCVFMLEPLSLFLVCVCVCVCFSKKYVGANTIILEITQREIE